MSDALPYDHHLLCEIAGEIIVNVRDLSARGWTPATSSNFSRRLDDRHAAITVSGRDKGKLTEADIMVVDFDGKAIGSEHRPSAETLLHTQLYRRFADIGCILHTHSQNQTVASRLFAADGHVRLADYELLKAFRGNETHETTLDLPVLPNSQHMPTLAAQVETLIGQSTTLKGSLSSNGALRIDGKFDGDIATTADIIVGESAVITATVAAKNAVVAGSITGNMDIGDKLELLPTAKVVGDLRVGSLIIGEGAIFKGNCEMRQAAE